MKLSKRVQSIKPSATLAIEAKAHGLKARGIDIISFGTGEPDFDTPLNIKSVAKAAIDSGFTKYCPVSGTPELKKAIVLKLKRDNHLDFNPEEIIVSCGAKHSLYNLFQAVLDPDDELIVPAPYWVSYPDMAMLAGAKSIIAETSEENGFKLTTAKLAECITPKTKAIVINSPSNPTGSTYTFDELKAIAEICVSKNILMISDEIYEKLVYDNFQFASIAQTSDAAKALTAVVNGVSKSYAMTGWRIGYTAGPKEIIDAMTKIQSQSTSNPASISLKAAQEALNGPQDEVEKMRAEFETRRDFIVDKLNSIAGIKCHKPEGAFYVFPNVKGLLSKQYRGQQINTSMELADYLLGKAQIAVIPGEAFGAPDHIRLSYATSIKNIEEGIKRIQQAIS